MRIVPSLKEIKKCLNCGSDNLHNCRNDKGTEYIFCGYCHEYVYESESTKSAPTKEEVTRAVQCLIDAGFEPDPNGMTISEMNEKFKKNVNVLFELREMAEVLPHWAESNRDTLLMQMIRDIFHKLIDYIEEN